MSRAAREKESSYEWKQPTCQKTLPHAPWKRRKPIKGLHLHPCSPAHRVDVNHAGQCKEGSLHDHVDPAAQADLLRHSLGIQGVELQGGWAGVKKLTVSGGAHKDTRGGAVTGRWAVMC